MSTVVIFGATGYAGSAIANELIERGHAVTAVSRKAGPEPAHELLTTQAGSLYESDELAHATAGADVIVIATPVANTQTVPGLVAALPSLLAAARANGARLGIVGGAGSLRPEPDAPMLLEADDFPEEFLPEATSHLKLLEALQDSDSDVDWFVVSPAAGFGAWNPGPRTGKYRVSDDGVLITDSEGKSAISAADLAVAFADEIERPAHHRVRFHVAN